MQSNNTIHDRYQLSRAMLKGDAVTMEKSGYALHALADALAEPEIDLHTRHGLLAAVKIIAHQIEERGEFVLERLEADQ
ncbi:MAG: hypothetical protein LC677_15620 [Halomonas sp.]|nr:hypothetical protein [Halomonas sp.]